MKIEILFPEFCNLYGDLANMDYLRRCLPQAEFVETSLQEEPLLAREKDVYKRQALTTSPPPSPAPPRISWKSATS